MDAMNSFSQTKTQGHWKNGINYTSIITACCVLLLVFLYWEIVYKLVLDWWDDPNYSHGFLIPFISAYLIWERRKLLRNTHPAPSVLGLPILFAAAIIYVIGQIAGEFFTQRLSLVMILAGLTLTWGGKAMWRILWVPILYLVFMIPLPYILYDSIAFPLKLLATKVSITVLQCLGQAMYNEGNLIFLPHTTLEVADACSGIRSLMSILALSVIIACYTQNRWPFRLLLVALSIPIVVFTNILRIIGTGLLAAKDPELSTGFFHAFSGEVIFLAGIALLFGIAILIGRIGRSKARVDTAKGPGEQPSSIGLNVTGHGKYLTQSASAGILLLMVVISSLATNVRATPLIRSLDLFPARIGEFVLVGDMEMETDVVKNLGVDHYVMRTYRSQSGYVLWLYIGYFEDQKQGAMIHSPKHCYPGSGWSPLSSEVIRNRIPDIGKPPIEINEYILEKGNARQLVYYWYQSRGRVLAGEYSDRFYMLLDSLVKRRSDGALVRISGPAEDLQNARETQQQFIRALYPALKRYLPS